MYAVEKYTREQLIPEAAPGSGGYILQVQIGAIALVAGELKVPVN